jgi:hypothetical protein
MSLAEMINSLINDLGTDDELNKAAIRNRLFKLRRRSKALDLALKRSDAAQARSSLNLKQCRAELKSTRAYLKRLKLHVEQEKLPPDKDVINEGERELLTLLAPSGGAGWISEIKAQHHAITLADKGFVTLGQAMLRHGKRHVLVSLTDKGTAYAAKLV